MTISSWLRVEPRRSTRSGLVLVLTVLMLAFLGGVARAQTPDRPIFSQGAVADINVGQTTRYTFGIERGGDIHAANNQSDLTGVAITIPLPAGVEVASPSGVTVACINVDTSNATAFTGVFAPSPGASSLVLTGMTLPPVNECSFGVDLLATTPGSKVIDPGLLTTDQTASRDPGTRTFTVTGVAAPTVTSLSPSSGAAAGGTSVTITGTDFTGATAVAFGGVAATAFTVNSATQITATAPAGTGTVDVRVTTPSGTSAVTAADQFTYSTPAPTVTAVAPASGPTAGGTSVVLTGTNFTGATAVSFGATAASAFTVNSATQITATAPAGTGTVNVRVTTAGGTSAIGAANQFTYVAGPTVTAVTPASGPTAGGTTVVVTGTNFTDATAVSFGATAASAFTVNSATQITATAPAGTGTVNVRVTTAGGTSATGAANQFTYVATPAAPVVVTPANGATTSDNSPTFTGTAPAGSTVDVIVDGASIGTTPADGAGGWTLTSGVLADGPHTVRATATTAGGTSPASSTNAFSVDTTPPPAPVVTAPANGSVTSDTTPTVSGTSEANATVAILIDGALAGTAPVDGAGAWSYTSGLLPSGVHTVRASATDPSGNTSPDSATNTFTIASSVSTLSGLTISSGALSPAFSSGVTSYTASVANGVTSVTVTPTLTNAAASITVNGVGAASGAASAALPLAVGANTITVAVTAQDGVTTSTYAVTVTRAPSAVSTLSALSLSTGTLSPAFSSGVTGYTAAVANGVTSVAVTPTLTDGAATMTVNGAATASGAASASLPLIVGDNVITIATTAQDGVTTSTYTVTVTRAPSAVSALSALSLSTGTLSPAFSSGVTGYTASVANGVTSVTVTPTLTNPAASITVNGVGTASGAASAAVPLVVGANTITVAVTAQDGVTTSTYTVTVTRAPSAVSTLSALSLSAGTLSPAFSSGGTSYTATVANGVTALTVTPTASDPTATVTVNGTGVTSGSPSGAIPLSVGANTITVVATAQDGVSTGVYSIVVTRQASSVATLSGLTLSSGTLSPAFNPGTGAYTTAVANAVDAVTVTPTVTDGTATVTVNGVATASGAASAAVGLAVGSNTITVVTTAQDGVTTQTYTVTVTRAASSVATLSNLGVSSGVLSPGFSSGGTAYSIAVDGGIDAITVTPTVTQANATVTVNGLVTASGAASASLPLNVGANTVIVMVTAQDGITTTTYTLTVSRAFSATSTLSGLTLSSGFLSPAFASGTTAYAASVDASTTSIVVTPTLTDPAGFVTVNGAPVGSGSASSAIPLNVGVNIITLVATAPNGLTSSTYTVAVTRGAGAPTAANVSGLSVPYNSNGFAIDLTGSITGTRTGVRIVTPPAHGTATVNGQVVTYTPASGYTGVDGFGWVADGPGGTSNAATVSLTVAAPTVPVIPPPPVTPTPPGDGQPVTVPLTDGGGSITHYEITVPPQFGEASVDVVNATPSGEAAAGPEHARSFVLRYRPNAGFMGTDTVTLVAVGPGGRSSPAVFTFQVAGKAPDLTATAPLGGSATLQPTTGLTGGPFQGLRITRFPDIGTATVQGLTIVYSPGAGSGGATSLDYVVDLPFGASAAGRVTLTAEPAPVIPALTATTLAGRPVTVSLTANALNGPFTGAAVTGVSPAGAGTVILTEGGSPAARTWDLTFTPAGTFTGQAVIGFTLSRGAVTGSGVLTVTVEPRPDPALDPEVRGIVSSQADTARRFAQTQSGNFLRRLDSVRDGDNRSSLALGLNGGDEQDVLSAPGDALRRQLGFEADPVSRAARETAWLLSPAEASSEGSGGARSTTVADERSPVGLWASGGVNWGRRDGSGRRDDRFTTSGLTAGVDWRVSETVILGAGVGYGRDRTDVGSDGSRSDGSSRTGALYAGFRPKDGLTVGGVLGHGELEFDSRRWSADAAAFALGERTGSVTFAALEAALDRQAGRWRWSPYGRLDMARIRLDAFSEAGAGPYALAYEALDLETMSGALGVRLNGRFGRHLRSFEPVIRIEWAHAFDDVETQYLRYADWVASPRYGLELDSWSRDQVMLDLEGRWSFGRRMGLTAGYSASLGDSSVSQGVRLRLQAKF